MARLEVTIADPLAEWIEAQVEQGLYASTQAYLQDLVSRDHAQDIADREARLADLKRKIDEGLADVEAGRVRDADEVFDEIRAAIIAKARRKKIG